MHSKQHYVPGDRVRVVCDCPGAKAGDEGTVIDVRSPEREPERLTILIDDDPATTHGTVVYDREVEPMTTEN